MHWRDYIALAGFGKIYGLLAAGDGPAGGTGRAAGGTRDVWVGFSAHCRVRAHGE